MKSKRFELVKKYYEKGLWKIGAVHNAVLKGWITAQEYEEIAGEVFLAEEMTV